MSFNVGAFAGALGQSALSTYERIGEEELRAMQRQKLRKEISDEAALDQALKTELGRVGQKDDYTQAIQSGAAVGEKQARALDTMGMEGLTNSPEDQAFKQAAQTSAVSALRENAGASPVQAIEAKEYTQAQALKGYAKAAAGVSRKGYLESLQIKSAAQESDAQDKFLQKRDELSEQLAMIKGIGQTGGMKGLFELGKKEGLELKFNEGKNGVGSRIDVLGPKGDVLKTYSDLESAQKALASAAMDRFQKESMSLLGSADKYISAMQGERKIDISQQEADTKQMVGKAQAGYYGAAAGNLNAKANTFMDKLPEKEKFRLNSLNSLVQTNEKAYTANPTPEGQLSLVKSKLELNKVLAKNGVLDNVYEGTGIPAPQEAASAILSAKVKPKDFNNYIANARKDFGRDYADELKLALNMNTPAKPAAINPAAPTNAVNLPRGQAAQQTSPRVKAALDFEKRQKAAAEQ